MPDLLEEFALLGELEDLPIAVWRIGTDPDVVVAIDVDAVLGF